jgi:hypothetical protein
MTTTEIELSLTIVFILCFTTYTFKQDIGKNLVIFVLGAIFGGLAQFPLGRNINLYTPNISFYVFYVSGAVIISWGIGLESIYGLHLWLSRIFKCRPGLVPYVVSTVPAILVLEVIGSNVIRMKLHDHTNYRPLAPALNAMHAPAWLYGYYLLVAIAFYFVLRGLRIHTPDWRGSRIRILSVKNTVQDTSELQPECDPETSGAWKRRLAEFYWFKSNKPAGRDLAKTVEGLNSLL